MRGPHIHERGPAALLDDMRGRQAGTHIFGIDGSNTVRMASDFRLGHMRGARSRFRRPAHFGHHSKMRIRHLVHGGIAALPPSPAPRFSRQPSRRRRAAPCRVTLRRESGNLVLEGIPHATRRCARSLARYLEGRDAKFLDWQPDGRCSWPRGSATWNRSIVSRLRSAPANSSLSTRTPFPCAAREHEGLRVPEGQGRRRERADSLLPASRIASIRLLTDGKSLNGSPVWAHDGKRLAFHSNARDGVSYDIYIVDVEAGTAPRLVVGGQQDTWYPLDWSPDDSKLLLWKYVSINESYLFVADVNTGT